VSLLEALQLGDVGNAVDSALLLEGFRYVTGTGAFEDKNRRAVLFPCREEVILRQVCSMRGYKIIPRRAGRQGDHRAIGQPQTQADHQCKLIFQRGYRHQDWPTPQAEIRTGFPRPSRGHSVYKPEGAKSPAVSVDTICFHSAQSLCYVGHTAT
jgi:hypothetical protein